MPSPVSANSGSGAGPSLLTAHSALRRENPIEPYASARARRSSAAGARPLRRHRSSASENGRALPVSRAARSAAASASPKPLIWRNPRRSAGPSSRSHQRTRARGAFGNDFEHFVSGGAPLADELADFFEAVGAPVVQGYGLTETGPVVAANAMGKVRRGSVGRLLDGTETLIAADGEILVRGPQVASFYRLDTGAAKSVSDDKGWFHTGDRGHTDGDGFLYVTGRIKSTIVLASGKNVEPEEIEACLRDCDAVTEAGVISLGDGNSVPDEEICLVAVPAQAFLGACSEPDGDISGCAPVYALRIRLFGDRRDHP